MQENRSFLTGIFLCVSVTGFLAYNSERPVLPILIGCAALLYSLHHKSEIMSRFSEEFAAISKEIANNKAAHVKQVYDRLGCSIELYQPYIGSKEHAALTALMTEVGVLLQLIDSGYINKTDKAAVAKKYFHNKNDILSPKKQYTFLTYVIGIYTEAKAIAFNSNYDNPDERKELLIKTANILQDICQYLITLGINSNPMNWLYMLQNGRSIPACKDLFIMTYLAVVNNSPADLESGSRGVKLFSPDGYKARSCCPKFGC